MSTASSAFAFLQMPSAGERRPLRVLHVSVSSVLEANRALDGALGSLGQTVLLVAPSELNLPKKDLGADPHREGVPFDLITLKRHRGHSRVAHWVGLAGTIDRFGPDILLSEQDPASAEGLQLKLAARRRRIPIVFCTAENVERNYLAEAKAGIARGRLPTAILSVGVGLFIKWAYRWNNVGMWSMNNDGVRIAKDVRRFRGPVVVAPLGVDEDIFYPRRDDSRRAAMGLRDFTFGQFGRITPEKGILDLLAAAGRLKHHRFQILLDSMEEYDDKAFVEKVHATAREYGIADRLVSFSAAHAEMPNYYNVIDCLVAPSIPTAKFTEQYGRVIAEAMACGVPVIVSDCGHFPDLVGEFGSVFPAHDVDALRARMERVLTEPEAARTRAVRAVEHFRGNLSARAHAKILLDLFWTLLDDARQGVTR